MVINQAMKKYGIENFTFEVIACCLNQDDTNDTETLLVIQEESHVSLGKGYNVSNGGSNAPKTETWKKEMSELRKGKPSLSPGNSPFVKGHKLGVGKSGPPKGTIPPNKRFTNDQIIEIKHQYFDLKISSRKLGKMYNVDKSTILNNVK